MLSFFSTTRRMALVSLILIALGCAALAAHNWSLVLESNKEFSRLRNANSANKARDRLERRLRAARDLNEKRSVADQNPSAG
jgi:hypothetical protein